MIEFALHLRSIASGFGKGFRKTRRSGAWSLAVLIGFCWAHPLQAGIGPENVVVVVNADSQDSRTLANHYVALRGIPSGNVILLSEVPSGLTISLAEFKDQILTPLLDQLNRRKLAPQTRVIAYSAAFPTSVKIPDHTARLTNPDQKKYQLPTASLTGLTYFYQFVLADNEKYLDWGSNVYARGPFERHFANPFFDEARRTRFDEAIASREAGDFKTAAATFEQLFEAAPTVAPLGILAAEARAKEGDTDAASRLIEQAVAAGWSSGTYLDESELLQPLMEASKLRALRERLDSYPTALQAPVGFLGNVGWTNCGARGSSLQEGIPYLMSCMLAVVHPRGSTVDQAVRVLEKASTSDSTYPQAAFWFTYTRDDRTNPRFPQLGNALIWLKKQGHDAEIIHAPMPTAKTGPCVGLMLGLAEIPLDNRPWNFVPGAISDNLTSLSAQFDTPAQTKITELLHAGAAFSCGPVFEPYNLPFKFPSAMMYAYYASGVSALEAFYLSVTSPYQLLAVGDPLAQPFANPPADLQTIQVQNQETNKPIVSIVRRALPLGDRQSQAGQIEIFLEGRLVQITPAVGRVQMTLPEGLRGELEVRSVLVGSDATQPRAGESEWILFGDVSKSPKANWVADQGAVEIDCPTATSIALTHHSEIVGTIEGNRGYVPLDRTKLGLGPLRLRPIAIVDGKQVPGQAITVTD